MYVCMCVFTYDFPCWSLALSCRKTPDIFKLGMKISVGGVGEGGTQVGFVFRGFFFFFAFPFELKMSVTLRLKRKPTIVAFNVYSPHRMWLLKEHAPKVAFKSTKILWNLINCSFFLAVEIMCIFLLCRGY